MASPLSVKELEASYAPEKAQAEAKAEVEAEAEAEPQAEAKAEETEPLQRRPEDEPGLIDSIVAFLPPESREAAKKFVHRLCGRDDVSIDSRTVTTVNKEGGKEEKHITLLLAEEFLGGEKKTDGQTQCEKERVCAAAASEEEKRAIERVSLVETHDDAGDEALFRFGEYADGEGGYTVNFEGPLEIDVKHL